jgi:TonB-dependent SusC/RagA subfamily outer membrane receptor
METMAATGIALPRPARLAAGLSVMLAAACAGNPPPQGPDPELEPDRVEMGYGTLNVRHLTSAVSRVQTNRPGDVRVGRVEELIQGRVSGVQVMRSGNGGYSVRIRGNGTLMGNGEPLYVLDGTPLHSPVPGHALSGINPADVTSIVVLKDAASAAIYGSQAANGVILISTRRRN